MRFLAIKTLDVWTEILSQAVECYQNQGMAFTRREAILDIKMSF